MIEPDDKYMREMAEASILLDAGARTIDKLGKDIEERDDTIAAMMIELGEWQTKYADACERIYAMEQEAKAMALLLDQKTEEIRELIAKVEIIQVEVAKVDHALTCSVQLIEALLAWLPEGLPLSPDVGSAKGAWSEAMKKITR